MRVAENLNHALHETLEERPDAMVLGEDIADPYGGAFRVTKGLSSRFPGRVLSTPISEGGIVGAAAGIALAGGSAIVEMMFSDFTALAFDQITNFAAKSVTMYGRTVPVPLIVRCPTGGRRGYGPTHSQSLQKHFVGVPNLALYEVSPFHDNRALLPRLLDAGRPCLLFEDKVLYTARMFEDGRVDDLFTFDALDDETVRVHCGDPGDAACVLIAPGGLAHRALAAMRSLLVEQEITCKLLVPSRLYPLDPGPLLPSLATAELVCVVEDSTAGGTWGADLAHQIHAGLWGTLRRPVRLIHGADAVIPADPGLERQVVVQDTTIHRTVLEALRD
jgi:pyruvate/2-oxoglutarate/acetoin dehydrogenase E1 component